MGELVNLPAAHAGPVYLHGIDAGISAQGDPATRSEYPAANHGAALEAVNSDRKVRKLGPAIGAGIVAVGVGSQT